MFHSKFHIDAPKKPTASRFFSRACDAAGFSAAMLVLALPGVSAGQSPGTLTEQQAIMRMLQRSEILAVLSSPLDQSRADLLDARLWPNASIEWSRQDVSRAIGDAREDSLWLRQAFDLGGSRRLQIAAAEARVGSAAADSDWRRRTLIADARSRFHALLAQQQRLETAVSWLAQLERALAVVIARFEAGEASGYERLRLARERDRASAIVRISTAERDTEWLRLAALLGDTGPAAPPPLLAGELLPQRPPPLEALLARLEERPDLRALARETDALAQDLAAAGRAWVPDFELGVGRIGVNDHEGNDSGMLLSARIGLPFGDRGQADRARTGARLSGARAALALELQHARAEIIAAHGRATALIDGADELERSGSGTAGELLAVGEAAYQGGELTLLELLDVYQSGYQQRIDIIDMQQRARAARIELDRLIPEDQP
jgi:outer membrane protein, heavy metal efflux system